MLSDYECPRCHNKFPESNKIMHDIRCTEENPLPKTGNFIPVPQNMPQKKEDEKIIKDSDVFECNICHMVLSYVEKNDHMICHDLEKQEKNKLKKLRLIAEQKKIQKEIEKKNKQNKIIEQQKQIERQIQLNNRNNQQHHIHDNNQRQNNNNNRNVANNNNIGINMINDNLSNLRDDIQNHLRINSPNSSNINNIPNNFNHNRNPIQNANRMINPNNHNNHVHIRIRPQNLNNNNGFMIFIGNNNNHNHNHRNHNPESRHEHPTDKQILNQLPETYIEDVNKLDNEKKNCVICLEDFENGDKAVILPCIHLFHNKCIKNWLKTQNCCPICKYKLTAQNMNSH